MLTCIDDINNQSFYQRAPGEPDLKLPGIPAGENLRNCRDETGHRNYFSYFFASRNAFR